MARLKQNYRLLHELINFLEKKHNENKGDQFAESYLILSAKLVIDINACKLVWERGLYGSAHALVTVILRTVRMAGALHLKPDLIPEYLDESKVSDQDREFRGKFSEGSLQRLLDERFGKLERGEYANFEKSLHGSSVGTKVFYSRIRHNSDGTKGGDLIFNAFLENEKGGSVINILSGAVFDMCGVAMEKYAEELYVKERLARYDMLHKAELKALLREQLKQVRETSSVSFSGSKHPLTNNSRNDQ